MTGGVFASLEGDTASLTSHFHPEIQLDNSCSYSCALAECHYTIGWNVVADKNNSIYFIYKRLLHDDDSYTIRVPSGYYTFEKLAAYIENATAEIGHKMQLKLNKATGRTTIITNDKNICIEVSTEQTDSLAPSLGFENGIYCYKDEHTSTNAVGLWHFPTIRLDCDLTCGTYHNGAITHTLCEFDLNEIDHNSSESLLDYKIVMKPRYPIYLPINRHRISSINITAFDQTGERLKFKANERLHCWIHIKKDVDLSER